VTGTVDRRDLELRARAALRMVEFQVARVYAAAEGALEPAPVRHYMTFETRAAALERLDALRDQADDDEEWRVFKVTRETIA